MTMNDPKGKPSANRMRAVIAFSLCEQDVHILARTMLNSIKGRGAITAVAALAARALVHSLEEQLRQQLEQVAAAGREDPAVLHSTREIYLEMVKILEDANREVVAGYAAAAASANTGVPQAPGGSC